MPFDPYTYDLAGLARQRERLARTKTARALLGVPQEARYLLWRGLTEAAQGALDLVEHTPAGVKHEPPVFVIQHAGQPVFEEASLRCQTLSGWHRVMGLELRLAAQVLEALILTGDAARYGPLLAEQCARVGQLYRELVRRAGAWMACALLGWELRMLHYRASPTVSPLVYD
jgi:hypothetical protein